MKRYFYLFIFLFIFFVSYNVNATTINPEYYNISATNGGTRNRYIGYSAIDDIGSSATYTLNTRYTGKLSALEFYLHYACDGGYRITLTLNMATDDWRNNFYSVSVVPVGSGLQPTISTTRITYVSMKKIYFSFTPSSAYDNFKITIQSPSLSSAFTGVSNWNLSSIELDDHYYDGSGGSGSSGSTPSPTPNVSNQDIINSSNQNTQDIMNNNDDNTSDIINNANENANLLNESLNNSCKNGTLVLDSSYHYTVGKYLDSSGVEQDNSSLHISPYLSIQPNSTYSFDIASTTSRYYCFYRSNKQLISCSSTNSSAIVNFTSPSGAYYLRITGPLNRDISITGTVCNNWTLESFISLNEKLGISTSSITDSVIASQSAITGAIDGAISQANQNKEELIENTTCPTGPLYLDYDTFKDNNFDGKYLLSDGSTGSSSSYAVSVYFKVKPDTVYELDDFTAILDRYLCFYSQSKSVLSCSPLSSGSITSPSNAAYLRISLRKDRTLYLKGPICNDWQKEGLTDIADALKSDNVDSGVGSNFFSDFTETDNGGISGIITKPLVLITSLLDNNSSCTDLSLRIKIPPDKPSTTVSFPSGCILWDEVPNQWVSVYQVFVVGFSSYLLLRRLFKDVEKLKNPDNDEVEVIDL